MNHTIDELKWGEWVFRRRRSDGHTVCLRVYEAIDELGRVLPATEYPSRTAIAAKLATGEVLDAGEYEYSLTD